MVADEPALAYGGIASGDGAWFDVYISICWSGVDSV